MISIDLIDLQDPLLKDRTKSIRFISHPEDTPDTNFWPLWTAKEAAFKAERIKQPFNPKSFAIQFKDESSFNWNGFSGKVYQSADWILSMLSDRKIDFVIFDAESNNPSKEIRDKIKIWYSANHQIDTIVSSDESGLPILKHNQSPISITHHGRFMAFAYLVE